MKKDQFEDVTLDELSLRYARLHALDIKKGCGEIPPEKHFSIALLYLSTNRFTPIGDRVYRIPEYSDFYSKNLIKAENES